MSFHGIVVLDQGVVPVVLVRIGCSKVRFHEVPHGRWREHLGQTSGALRNPGLAAALP